MTPINQKKAAHFYTGPDSVLCQIVSGVFCYLGLSLDSLALCAVSNATLHARPLLTESACRHAPSHADHIAINSKELQPKVSGTVCHVLVSITMIHVT